MKTLDKYILKSFLKPFFATFLIILFVLVMQFLWQAFDSFVGKGISVWFILKFLWYVMLLVTPQAIPIGVLLSSIMTLGSLSENYEFAAAKSAGVSLQRIVRPLAILVLFLSVINFGFYNYVYPYAMLKQINLKMNAKKKQPALALVPGSFNTEIPNYHIKFDEKYGKEENLLKNVIIYDLSSRKGNNKIISAKKGELVSEEGSRYMTLILKDGHFFEHHVNNSTSYKKREKMPASYANFDEYIINIDISSFSKDDLEDLKYTRNFNMLSLAQLKDTMPDLKQNFDEYINSRSRNLFLNIDAQNLYKHHDSVIKKELSTNILENFDLKTKVNILETSVSKIDRAIENIESNKYTFKLKRKIVNLYDIEFYNRVALSLSCLLLFFVGAPLGSIIRKGGMGLPMILAILIYVTYHFSNTFGRNLAEESSLTAIAGSWLAVALMTPLAILLTVRATQDKGLNISSYKFLDIFIIKIKKYFLKDENLYEYNISLTKQFIDNNSSKFLNLKNTQLIDIARNFHQYDYTKPERQLVLNILSKREGNFDFLKSSGKLENEKYQKIYQQFKEFKLITNTAFVFWIFSFLIGLFFLEGAGIIGIVIWLVIQIVYILILIKTYKTYDELNINIDGNSKYNTAIFFIGGIFFYIIVNYLIVSEIKDKIKNIT